LKEKRHNQEYGPLHMRIGHSFKKLDNENKKCGNDLRRKKRTRKDIFE
jgi:hypothetical protein